MNLVVTGAAGFIGSHVAEILAASGHRVLGIDDLSGGFRENVPLSVEFLKCSVLEPLDDVFAAFRPDAVYHLAAYAAEGLSHHIPVFNYTNNTVGTANVLAASMRAEYGTSSLLPRLLPMGIPSLTLHLMKTPTAHHATRTVRPRSRASTTSAPPPNTSVTPISRSSARTTFSDCGRIFPTPIETW